MKTNLSKIGIDPVMLKFLAATENTKLISDLINFVFSVAKRNLSMTGLIPIFDKLVFISIDSSYICGKVDRNPLE